MSIFVGPSHYVRRMTVDLVPGLEPDDEPVYVDELDEGTLAILVALESFGTVRRDAAFEAKHPRGPDGRFLSLVHRLTNALQDWLNGDGDGDPFEGFSREQLRKAAKARGISLKKGASRDEIAALLLDDLKPKHGIGHVSDDVKQTIFGSYKAQPAGQLLSSPAPDSYDNLVAVAHVYGNKVPGGLTVEQAAQIVDEELAKNLGVPNAHLLENKVKNWLGTADGASYASTHTTPKKSIVDALTGKVDLPELKPGEKVQKVSGPGAVKGLKEHDFYTITANEMQAMQDKHLADTGTTFTPEQVSAMTNWSGGGYTGMNGYLRDTFSHPSPLIKKRVVQLQSAMLPLSEHVALRRGTHWDALPDGFQDAASVKNLKGKTFADDGFFATSVAGSGGHFSFNPVQWKIEAPKGTRGAFLRKYSQHPGENELLLAAGTRFRVVSVELTPSGVTIIRVRVVTRK